MEEYRKSAMAHYESMPEEHRASVNNFFKALDTDGNGSVSLTEFVEFLSEAGFAITGDNNNPVDMFKMFDHDGNGKLDFNEVITLFHYLTVGPGAKPEQLPVIKSMCEKRSTAGGTKDIDKKERCDGEKWMEAFIALNAILNTGILVGSVATTCSIM